MNGISSLPIACELAPIVAEVDRLLGGRLWQFTIEQDADGLVLTGTAPSYYVKQLAQHAVGQMTHLPIERNEIEVTEATPLSSPWHVPVLENSPGRRGRIS